jgi:hypothetical protein
MEARINQTSALSTSSSAIAESIGLLLLLLLKIDNEMASADSHASLAQTPYDFYGGENCKVVGTLHNIVDPFIHST